MLKLMVQHSPTRLACVCGLHLPLPTPPWQPGLRLPAALVVSAARHTTLASLARRLVEAPAPAHGADTLRRRPWTAAAWRAPLRHCIVADVVAYAHQSDQWPLSVRLDDSGGDKDKSPRHLAAVADHQEPTKSQGQTTPYSPKGAVHGEGRCALGARSYAYDGRLSLREKTGRRLQRARAPEPRRHLRQQTPLAPARLAAFQPRWPSGVPVDVLFDRWEAAKRLRTCCRRQGWQGVGAITAHRQLDAPQRSQWPQALRHQRYPRVQRAATDGRPRASLVRPLQGRRHSLSFAVCVLSSKRPPRDKPPQYCLGTDLSWSAQPILSISPKRWPSEVDNFYVKQPLGWADLRGQSDEAPEKWGAMVFLALVFLQWRLPHAHAKEHSHSLADVVRPHRYDHARPLLETTGQEAAPLRDSFPVLKRFLCQPTSDGTKRQRPVSEREAP